MRLKVLRTVGKKDTLGKSSDNPNSLELPAKPDGTMYQEGEVADFSKADAEKFVKSGMGEETDLPVGPPPKPVLTAVPVVMVERDETHFREPKPEPVAKAKAAPPAGADYEGMTVEELHKMAADRNLEGRAGLNKADTIKLLEKDDKKGKK